MNAKRQTVGDVLDEMDRANVPATVETMSGGILNVIAKAAADPNTDVDKLERLLAIARRMATSR